MKITFNNKKTKEYLESGATDAIEGKVYFASDGGGVYTGDSEGNYVQQFETGQGVIDMEMSDESTHAVRNNVIKAYVDDAVSKTTNKDIPKLFWTGSLPTTKDQGNIVGSVKWVSATESFDCYGTLKVQGNSSTAYPKKNFTLTLYSDAECTTKLGKNFKGWGSQSKFVMKANWIDLSHARNVVSCRIWSDVVASRPNYEDYPEAFRTSPNNGVIDGFPIRFYANGVYQGRYAFNIPKDAWMANMDKNNDDELIMCGENYVGGCFRALPQLNESDWTDELHATVPQSVKTAWTNAVSFVMNSSDADFKEHLSDYFDVQSLIDYDIYGIVSCNLDGFAKNQMYQKYASTPYIAQCYDMDSTWGLWWNGQSFVAVDYARNQFQDYQDSPTHDGNLLFVRLETLFSSEIAARWRVLRDSVLSVDNLILAFEEWTDICPKELVEEDYASTTANGAFTNIPSKANNNIQQLRDYIVRRRAYLDTQFVSTDYFNMSLSKRYAQAEEEIDVIVSTNLNPATFTAVVTGPATFNSSTMKLVIDSAAENGDVITITITSDADSSYTATASVSVSEIALLYAFNQEYTYDTSEAEDTGLDLLSSNHTDWTLFAKVWADSGHYQTIYALDGTPDGQQYFCITRRANGTDIDLPFNNLNLMTAESEMTVGLRRQDDSFYYTSDGTNWTLYDRALPVTSKTLVIGAHKNDSNQLVQPWDGNIICNIYDGQVNDLSSVWNTAYINNPRYIVLNTHDHDLKPGDTLQLSVLDTNYRDQRWSWSITGNATISASGLVTVNDDAEDGDAITVTCTALNTTEQALPATATCHIDVATLSEQMLWSNKTTDGTAYMITLANGPDGDVNFGQGSGDYIEAKIDSTNEPGAAVVLSFGTNIGGYNNAMHIEKQMAGNSWVSFKSWLNTSAGSGSVQVGINPGYIYYVRYCKDGMYYSLDGTAWTKIVYTTGNQQVLFDTNWETIMAAPNIQIGSTGTGTRPNGTFLEYVKIVHGQIEYYYNLESDVLEGNPGDEIQISVDTNLASTDSTFTVVGHGTFDDETLVLTINDDADPEDEITVTGVSDVDSSFSDSLTVSVVPPLGNEIYLDQWGGYHSTPQQFNPTSGYGPLELPAIDWDAGDALEYRYRCTSGTPIIVGDSNAFPMPNRTYAPKAHALFDWPNGSTMSPRLCDGDLYPVIGTVSIANGSASFRITKDLIQYRTSDSDPWTTMYTGTISFQDPTILAAATTPNKLFIGTGNGTFNDIVVNYIKVEKASPLLGGFMLQP